MNNNKLFWAFSLPYLAIQLSSLLYLQQNSPNTNAARVRVQYELSLWLKELNLVKKN